MNPIAENEKDRPVGGRIKHFLPNWQMLTKDPWVLTGVQLKLRSRPIQEFKPPKPVIDAEKSIALEIELEKLAAKRAISLALDQSESFLSPKFFGTQSRWFLETCYQSLLTQSVCDIPSFQDGRDMSSKGSSEREGLNGKAGFKECLSLSTNDWRFHRFEWCQRISEFNCLPFGLNSAPYTFTKLLKPALALLRI